MKSPLKQPSGYVAMYVTRDTSTAVDRIEFFNSVDGFGALHNATIYQTPTNLAFVDHSWLSIGQIVTALLQHLKDKADLQVVADFDAVPLDDEAVPRVFHHTLFCSGCDHTWATDLAKQQSKFVCPRCRSVVRSHPQAIQWAGPDNATLKAVWDLLPYPSAAGHVLPAGLNLRETDDGCLIGDELGNIVKVTATPDGLHITVGSSQGAELNVAVGQEGIDTNTSGGV